MQGHDNDNIDEFGDSFTEPVTPQQLKELVYRSPDLSWRRALKDMVILSQDLTIPILTVAKLHGATITEDKEDASVTHHFMDTLDCIRRDQLQANLLTKKELADMLKPHVSKDTYNCFCSAN